MSNVRIVRIIRVTRLLRVLRVARVFRFVSALRQLIVSILGTLRALFWAMILLVLIIYVFGIVFTQAAKDYRTGATAAEGDPDDAILNYYWGGLLRSMFTLYKAISDGVSWDYVVHPLQELGPIWVGIFFVYITFTYFAVLNVLTAVFCQTAIDSEKYDEDAMIQSMLARKQTYVRQLEKLYQSLDPTGTGHITLRRFEESFAKPAFKAFFSALDLEPDDAWVLFKLLDVDSTRGIDHDEFVMGCLRLRGFAKSVDMAKLMTMNVQVLDRITEVEEKVRRLVSLKVDQRRTSKGSTSSTAGIRLSSSGRRISDHSQTGRGVAHLAEVASF